MGSRRQRVLRLPLEFRQPARARRSKQAETGDRRDKERRDAGSREGSSAEDAQVICS
jgi:hypothetical protein